MCIAFLYVVLKENRREADKSYMKFFLYLETNTISLSGKLQQSPKFIFREPQAVCFKHISWSLF